MGNLKQKLSFREYLELNKYAPRSQYTYLLYESLLPNELNVDTINDFVKVHNTQPVRSFLRLYLFSYLKLKEDDFDIPRFVSIHKGLPNPKEILYFDEVKKVLAESESLDVKLCVRSGFIPGLRVSEMVGDGDYITPLTPESIDFTHLTVAGTGKGNKDYIQPINIETAKALKFFIDKYKLGPKDRIFDMTRQTLLSYLQQECREIVDKHIVVHSLRSSCGTYLVECGVNPIAIKEYLRHEKLETIMKYIVLSRTFINKEVNEKTTWV